jgi:hypothetical protein
MDNLETEGEQLKTISRLQNSLSNVSGKLTSQQGVPGRRRSMVYFNELKLKEERKDDPEEEKEDDDYETMKLRIQMMNKDEVNNQINDFIFSRDPESKKKITHNENVFNKTRYANQKAFPTFFDKYKLSEKMIRKGISIETPSFNLIKSLNENHLVPNPVGLVKRNGIDSSMNLK